MEKATRHNEGKLKWSLVDFEALTPMVRGLEFGAKKYGVNNWKKGLPTTEVCESLLRHTFAYLSGEDIDPESGLPHIAHIQDNALFLGYMDMKKPEFDDRVGKIKRTPALLKAMRELKEAVRNQRPFEVLFGNKKKT